MVGPRIHVKINSEFIFHKYAYTLLYIFKQNKNRAQNLARTIVPFPTMKFHSHGQLVNVNLQPEFLKTTHLFVLLIAYTCMKVWYILSTLECPAEFLWAYLHDLGGIYQELDLGAWGIVFLAFKSYLCFPKLMAKLSRGKSTSIEQQRCEMARLFHKDARLIQNFTCQISGGHQLRKL